MINPPGRSLIALGPSGTGKSTLAASAVRYHGSGVIITCPGTDEMESYHEFYDEAERPVWHEDGSVELPDTPYLMAGFDDEDFTVTGDRRDLKADGLRRMIFFLRAVRATIQQDLDAGKPPRWGCFVQDTWAGIATLAHNSALANLGETDVPKARGDGGATFYIGLASRLHDVARASRALKGLGLDWVATSHVKVTDVEDSAKVGAGVTSKTQYMPLITGSFREQLTPMFDLVLHSEVQKDPKNKDKLVYQVRHDIDMRRQAKVRGLKRPLTADGCITNDYETIIEAYLKARS